MESCQNNNGNMAFSLFRRSRLCPFLLLLLAWVISCAGNTKLSSSHQVLVNKTLRGAIMELRQSCYVAELYDENELLLLSPRRLQNLRYLVDMDGHPIVPGHSLGIIPAGTKVQITRIDFPTGLIMSRRILTSPRHHPWVIVQLLSPAAGSINDQGRPFVMLLPMEIPNAEAVMKEIDFIFSPVKEVSDWLATRRPSVQVAIAHKTAQIGMDSEELIAALGIPYIWFNLFNKKDNPRVAWYPKEELWFLEGRIVAIHPSRAENEAKKLRDAIDDVPLQSMPVR